jgi:glycerol kinase
LTKQALKITIDPMNSSYILAIDQGTSSTKTVVFSDNGKAIYKASEPLKTHYLENHCVEQDPEEIYKNVLLSVEKCINGFKATGGEVNNIKACGISNQRETFVLWDRQGKSLYNAVVWQCKRSVGVCGRLKEEGREEMIRQKTGLIIDPYFSGTKVVWLYENIDKVKQAVDARDAYFGTVDTWLLYNLTKGASYFTDVTNASRTMFFNLSENTWDQELLERLGLSGLNLPEAKPSSFNYGSTDFEGLLDHPIGIYGMIGDSHAAAFGEGLYSPGTAKATLGTGCSILMNVGQTVKPSGHGMVSTICWSTENRTDYALEGIIVSCGATLEWLKNKLGIFGENRQIEEMNNAVKDNNGVYLVPAFSGLGAPHWDMNRKASIIGLSFDCNKNHILRAALESIPYQIIDVISAMEQDSGIELAELQVDGGISSDRFVLQLLADLLGKPVVNIGIADVSALGAAYMAGLCAGVFKDLDQLKSLHQEKVVFTPGNHQEKAKEYYEGSQQAVAGVIK